MPKRLSQATSLLVILAAMGFVIGAVARPQNAVWRPAPKRSDALKVLVVTGGHDYHPTFYSLFEGYDDLSAVVNPHPRAFQSDLRKRVEVLVLYDSIQQLEPEKQRNLRDFVESGKGLVVLHHAICDYVTWPWWYQEVVGGRWLYEPDGGKPATSYKHDEDILASPVGQHPITRGISPFRIWDETYKGLWISTGVKVVLQTDHPGSDGPLAWISPYEKSRVVYIQLGHDRNAHLNPHYRSLVRNAILWSAGRLK